MKMQSTLNVYAAVHKAPKLMVMVGVPGSGKSTKAAELVKKHPLAVLLSRDNIRSDMQFSNESTLTQHMWHAAVNALQAGKDVIVDSPNMEETDKPAWENIAIKSKAALTFYHMNVPVSVAINRDAKRPMPVGKDKIKSIAGIK